MKSCCSQNAPAGSLVETLAEEHERFLAFVTRRVKSRALAEEILQDAYVRSLDHADSLADGESVTAWFYRVLRNAIVDAHRRRGAEERGIERVAGESETATPSPDDELMGAVCSCVRALADELKPEYREAILRVDVEGQSVSTYADELAIQATNARVRLHRARAALRKKVVDFCGSCATEGCRDCGCHERRTASA